MDRILNHLDRVYLLNISLHSNTLGCLVLADITGLLHLFNGLLQHQVLSLLFLGYVFLVAEFRCNLFIEVLLFGLVLLKLVQLLDKSDNFIPQKGTGFFEAFNPFVALHFLVVQ